MNFMTLRSRSTAPLLINHLGKQHLLDVGEEKSFPTEIAGMFADEYGPLIDRVHGESIGAIFKDKTLPQTMWLANVTGNHELPARVIYEYVKDRRIGIKEKIELDNPLRVPTDIQLHMKGAEIQYLGPHSQPESKMSSPFYFEVPAYQRRELPIAYAKWLLHRDRNNETFRRGQIVKSRAPSEFEPKMDWPLDDLRIYLRFCDVKATAGVSEHELRLTEKDNFDSALYDAKRGLMKKLFFRVVNPDIRLPTRAQFEDLKRGGTAPVAKVSQEQAAALLQKARLEQAAAIKHQSQI